MLLNAMTSPSSSVPSHTRTVVVVVSSMPFVLVLRGGMAVVIELPPAAKKEEKEGDGDSKEDEEEADDDDETSAATAAVMTGVATARDAAQHESAARLAMDVALYLIFTLLWLHSDFRRVA